MVYDYDKSYVEFHNGQKMPIIGIGTWAGPAEDMKVTITTALEVGYRHIDTAFVYENERAIGETLKGIFAEGKIQRKDIFVVTKLPPNGMRASDVKHFLKASLFNLQLDYVDLYLVQTCVGFENVGDSHPFPRNLDGTYLLDMNTDLPEIWKAMEEMVNLGWAKSIGVSNWSVNQLQRILKTCKIKPANVQIECHAYFQQNELVDFCQKHDITVCAYAPIGSPGMPAFLEKVSGFKVEIPCLMKDPLIVDLAHKYKTEPPQILLRFLIQRGIAVIPKSITPKRIITNFNIFDFKLDAGDMMAISKLDGNSRLFRLHHITGIENHPEYGGYI